MIRLYALWEQLSGTFWFVPGVMVVGAIVLAVIMPQVDQAQGQGVLPGVLYTGSPDGARSLLSTIAGGMISVAGVTFSITIATLSLASSQLGPRLLSNFMRDRGNQIVLGTFVANFMYCLLVLRTIRSADEAAFVPHLSVTLAIVLAIISLGVLIFFFHHVSTMIQAENLVASIGKDLTNSVNRLFSVESRRTPYEYALRGEDDIPADFDENSDFIVVTASGYLQAIDYDALLRIAHDRDLLLLVLYRPGDFMATGAELVGVYPAEGIDEELEQEIMNNFTVGVERLRLQDVEFAIDQLVEIAVRALSPGINDPFTAIACLNQLSIALSELADRPIPSGYYYDDEGDLRIISDAITFDGIIDAAFNQIRQHGRTDVAVTIRLLEVIGIIIARTETESRRQTLLKQAEMIKRASDEAIFEAHDRADITDRYQLILDILDETEG